MFPKKTPSEKSGEKDRMSGKDSDKAANVRENDFIMIKGSSRICFITGSWKRMIPSVER